MPKKFWLLWYLWQTLASCFKNINNNRSLKAPHQQKMLPLPTQATQSSLVRHLGTREPFYCVTYGKYLHLSGLCVSPPDKQDGWTESLGQPSPLANAKKGCQGPFPQVSVPHLSLSQSAGWSELSAFSQLQSNPPRSRVGIWARASRLGKVQAPGISFLVLS